MIKSTLRIATIAATALISSQVASQVQAQPNYGEAEVNPENVVAVAVPYGTFYNLLVIEQVPDQQDCWDVTGTEPAVVDPLLLNFDFTGSCKRATDPNGYSVRIDGQDYGSQYLLRIVENNGELLLVGTPRDRSGEEITIGRTYGMEDGFLKIYLDPGWEFTKRTYEGKTLGHYYFSGDSQKIGMVPTTPPTAASFSDIGGDIYRTEIEEAVALGFISGFKEDNTFRPEQALTREQLVSMVIEALETIPELEIVAPENVTNDPYPDVAASRWSASKIEWAKNNGIVQGYPDGTFDPAKPVTRAELMAVLRQATQWAKVRGGQTETIETTLAPANFTDINGHWAEDLISTMSAYCNVASPLNEAGNQFYPNESSSRNYAAAATLRMRNCVGEEIVQVEPETNTEETPEIFEQQENTEETPEIFEQQENTEETPEIFEQQDMDEDNN